MPSTLIAGAAVYDGTGSPPQTKDVLIDDSHIVAVGVELAPDEATVVAGSGLAVAPGFIDMHSHADFTLPSFPAAINSLSQGVTTEVVGNCGWSPAPLATKSTALRQQWQQVASALGPDLTWEWSDFAGFLTFLDKAQPAVNCVPLVGHSAIRAATFGIEDRPPSSQELQEMRHLLAVAFDAGAWGLSTGLVYPPSSYSSTEEVTTLVSDVASRDGIYSTHMRDEGNDLLVAIEEALEVARTTGARVQISHLKAAGPANHGRIIEALDAIDRARHDEGLRVGCDAYPYLAGSTVLTQLLPAWTAEGGVKALLHRLNSPEMRRQIAAEVKNDPNAYLNKAGGWGNVMLAAVNDDALKRYEGQFLPAIAIHEDKDEFEVLFDLLVEDHARSTMILFLMDNSDMEQVLDHDSTVIGSDQLGVLGPNARVHPRAYGTFAKVLHRAAAKDEHALADIIARCTGQTAKRLGLNNRGLIHPGYIADLVLFNPQTISDRATYADPTLTASGIKQVYLSGVVAVDNGQTINTSLGRVLRRTTF